jgi:hypothetical protein
MKNNLSNIDEKKIIPSVKGIIYRENEFYNKGTFYILASNNFFVKDEYDTEELKYFFKHNSSKFHIFFKDTYWGYYFIKLFSSMTNEEYKNKFDLNNKEDNSCFFSYSQNVGTIEEFEKLILK